VLALARVLAEARTQRVLAQVLVLVQARAQQALVLALVRQPTEQVRA